eukprot:1161554-Pelagomonas_calceolata.AAC.3
MDGQRVETRRHLKPSPSAGMIRRALQDTSLTRALPVIAGKVLLVGATRGQTSVQQLIEGAPCGRLQLPAQPRHIQGRP